MNNHKGIFLKYPQFQKSCVDTRDAPTQNMIPVYIRGDTMGMTPKSGHCMMCGLPAVQAEEFTGKDFPNSTRIITYHPADTYPVGTNCGVALPIFNDPNSDVYGFEFHAEFFEED